MLKEIGSEFHFIKSYNSNGIKFPRDGSLTFCGRTAIETVLKKIPKTKTALLPSYCCDSMIEPFRRAGIEVDFFNVNFTSELKIDIKNKSSDVLLWCNYFGFRNEMPNYDGIIIEDITHSLFSKESYHLRSDYLVASIRKWLPIYCGGYCSVNSNYSLPPQEFIAKKAEAMNLKSQHLNSFDEEKKAKFLSDFNNSNKWIAENYSNLNIDTYSKDYISSVDVVSIREKRRKNASILYDGLKDKVEFMFDKNQMDCPLFVPIILRKGRDEIRRYLSDNKIYCPIHWPHPNADCKSNLYGLELSLVCDQRYNEDDMERIVTTLRNKL